MFEEEKQRIDEYRKTRNILNIVWVAVKLAVAYTLITYIDYGLFIVIGYVLYALENTTGLQFINAKEVDLQINVLHQRINEIESNNSEKQL